MGVLGRHSGTLIAFLGAAVFAAIVPRLYATPRHALDAEMQVRLPRFVQVLMAGGDRYLAANLASFRALVVSTDKMRPDDYRILGQVQSDAAWLNPAHEDNYYIAAAILPWNGEVSASQEVLRQATLARRFDWQPPLFYAFNAMHFLKDPVTAANWLEQSSRYLDDEIMQIEFQQTAALWVSKGEDPLFAIGMHRAMAKETKNRAFARFLEQRAMRLENLLAIDRAVANFRLVHKRFPFHLAELKETGFLTELPVDPFGAVYTLSPGGQAELAKKPSAAVKEE